MARALRCYITALRKIWEEWKNEWKNDTHSGFLILDCFVHPRKNNCPHCNKYLISLPSSPAQCFAKILPILLTLVTIVPHHASNVYINFNSLYCSAWSRYQFQNQSFGPKQSTKLTVDPPPPPTHLPKTFCMVLGFFWGHSISQSKSLSFSLSVSLIERLTQAEHF